MIESTEPELPADEVAAIRDAIDVATRNASFAASNAVIDDHRAELGRLPQAIRDGVMLRAALTFLFARGFVAPAPALTAEGWLPLDIPEPFHGDLVAAIREAVAAQDRIEAALPPSMRPQGWAPASGRVDGYIRERS